MAKERQQSEACNDEDCMRSECRSEFRALRERLEAADQNLRDRLDEMKKVVFPEGARILPPTDLRLNPMDVRLTLLEAKEKSMEKYGNYILAAVIVAVVGAIAGGVSVMVKMWQHVGGKP